MKQRFNIAVFVCMLLMSSLTATAAHGDETYLTGQVLSNATVRFNNENWNTLPHPRIAEFTVRDDGSAFGLTETGVSFIQYNVPNDIGIRVQRFEIQDHYHYIVEGEIVDTVKELSERLALAYEAQRNAV